MTNDKLQVIIHEANLGILPSKQEVKELVHEIHKLQKALVRAKQGSMMIIAQASTISDMVDYYLDDNKKD